MNIVINDRTFESSHALVYGDYVGAGSVGVANVLGRDAVPARSSCGAITDIMPGLS